MRRLWRVVYGHIVCFHADYWTGFERLKEKYKPNDGPGPHDDSVR